MSEKTPFEPYRPRYDSQQEAALHPAEQVILLANMALKESLGVQRELEQNEHYAEAAAERAHNEQLYGLVRHLVDLIEDEGNLSLLDLDEADFTTEVTSDLIALSEEEIHTATERGRINGTDQFLELLVPHSVPDDQREIHFKPWTRGIMERKNPLPQRPDGSFRLYLKTTLTPSEDIQIRYLHESGNHMPRREIGRTQAFREDEA